MAFPDPLVAPIPTIPSSLLLKFRDHITSGPSRGGFEGVLPIAPHVFFWGGAPRGERAPPPPSQAPTQSNMREPQGFARSGGGLGGRFHSSHRAVTGDAEAVGGRLLAVGTAVGGWCWGMGMPLGQSEGWSLRGGGGGTPRPFERFSGEPPVHTARPLPHSLAIGLLAFVWDRTAGCSFATGEAKMAKARVRLVTRGRSFSQLLIIATSVVLLFLYPTLNKRTTMMNKCDTFDVNVTANASNATGAVGDLVVTGNQRYAHALFGGWGMGRFASEIPGPKESVFMDDDEDGDPWDPLAEQSDDNHRAIIQPNCPIGPLPFKQSPGGGGVPPPPLQGAQPMAQPLCP